jgi:hypothetical protein
MQRYAGADNLTVEDTDISSRHCTTRHLRSNKQWTVKVAKEVFVGGVGREGEAGSFRGVSRTPGWRDCQVLGVIAPRYLKTCRFV